MLPLTDLRVVEVSAFVAAPLGGMTLARLGADVIRIDPIGGNFDYTRWPITKDGVSLYWTGLNKGKRSVTLAMNKPEGREIATRLITAPGPNSGILLTNLGTSGWMSYASLSKHRPDLIMMVLTGHHDGATAVDYTINCAGGFPSVTGEGPEPVNAVLPAWDVASGLYLSTGILAAERVRTRTGKGQEVKVALSDVMYATIGDLGYIADVQINKEVRKPIGNYLYGAFAKDFPTGDGRRVMLVGITDKQFEVLAKAMGLTEQLAALGPKLGVDMNDEGGRYAAREAIAAIMAPWCAARTLAEIRTAFEGTGVLWGPYQDFGQLVAEDPRCSPANPLFKDVDQPGVGRYMAPASPLAFGPDAERRFRPAPQMGQHTDQVLSEVLGMSSGEIGKLHDAKIIA